ncbi:hypothetical protein LIER_43523 [Lithospermum erythrorhizon]|uniref:Uncharacterized protein n=1 Tax=Lithospermum erythrorhizon TaxID=34254 RepID=A0AAV3QC65_LITER
MSSYNGLVKGSKGPILVEPVPKPVVEKEREMVMGRNVHTTCLEVTEPEDDDDSTGDKEAHMAAVLARYRKTLVERTKHHLGHAFFLFILPIGFRLYSLPIHMEKGSNWIISTIQLLTRKDDNGYVSRNCMLIDFHLKRHSASHFPEIQ